MTTNTQQKAQGAANSKGLHNGTNNADFASHGPIQQVHDSKSIANQITRLALAGHRVIFGDRGDFTVCKYGLTRYCNDFVELQDFACRLGVNRD
ncbi:MAG: hypothetical protein KA740_11515 [Rhodoferax sp.]|jgi:hypothetical protein|nr:hypothetical protein [Rhodoferax sp.]